MYNDNLTTNRRYEYEDHSLLADINIIPLVDIMLVLLIVFMVAAPLSLTTITVNIPKSSEKKILLDEPQLILSIDKSGNYFISKNLISKDGFKEQLKLILQARNSKDLFINADASVSYGQVVEAMSAAKEAGIKKVSMITKPMTKK